MTFAESLDELLKGNKVRREDWEDEGDYIVMKDEKLMIFKPEDNMLHPLIVSTGDLTGTDWVTC